MARERRRVKARYRTKALGKIKVIENRASIDKDTKSLQQSRIEVEKDLYMVYFPHGHSIRITKDEVVRMGYHLKPKLVDMDTGETVDLGGDIYDFMGMDDAPDPLDDFAVELKDDDDLVIDEVSDTEKTRRKA